MDYRKKYGHLANDETKAARYFAWKAAREQAGREAFFIFVEVVVVGVVVLAALVLAALKSAGWL